MGIAMVGIAMAEAGEATTGHPRFPMATRMTWSLMMKMSELTGRVAFLGIVSASSAQQKNDSYNKGVMFFHL